jgi:PDZ domain
MTIRYAEPPHREGLLPASYRSFAQSLTQDLARGLRQHSFRFCMGLGFGILLTGSLGLLAAHAAPPPVLEGGVVYQQVIPSPPVLSSPQPQPKTSPLTLPAAIQASVLPDMGVVGLECWVTAVGKTYPVLTKIIPGSPADKAQLRVGDVMLQIDGLSTLGLSKAELDALISNQIGQTQQVVLYRPSRQALFKSSYQVAPLSTLAPVYRGYYQP